MERLDATKVLEQSVDQGLYGRRHIRAGWWSVLVFAVFGLGLESLHGFKVRAYLDVSNETRRLMWTLAHAHGVLLGLLNVVVGLSLRTVPELNAGYRRLMSAALLAATVLIPVGFFLGGIGFYSGDPGLGVIILPIGAVFLLIALFLLARSAGSPPAASQAGTQKRSKRDH